MVALGIEPQDQVQAPACDLQSPSSPPPMAQLLSTKPLGIWFHPPGMHCLLLLPPSLPFPALDSPDSPLTPAPWPSVRMPTASRLTPVPPQSDQAGVVRLPQPTLRTTNTMY